MWICNLIQKKYLLELILKNHICLTGLNLLSVEMNNPQNKPLVVQRYVARPYLINETKVVGHLSESQLSK